MESREDVDQTEIFIKLKFFPVRIDQAYLDSIPEEVKINLKRVWPMTFGPIDREWTTASLSRIQRFFGDDLDCKLLFYLKEYYGRR